jgi:CBS domain-containing protein
MTETLTAVLAHKGGTVHSVPPDATVLEAVRTMNEARIGAVMVCESSQILGIFTERDVLCRVVDKKREPASTRVYEVMTSDVVTVPSSITVEDAMAVITEKRCRHLPVVDDEKLEGLVSSGDLTRWIGRNQQHHIQNLMNFITGKYPG